MSILFIAKLTSLVKVVRTNIKQENKPQNNIAALLLKIKPIARHNMRGNNVNAIFFAILLER